MKNLLTKVLFPIAILASCTKPTEKEIINLPRASATDVALEAAIDSFHVATQTVPVAPDSITLHSVMIIKHGQVVAEHWYNGQAADMPHELYSVSKTFTAVAVGMAIDEGRFKLSDKVISFFPDKLPEDVSDNLSAITIRDLLTMTCGHDTEASLTPGTEVYEQAMKDPNSIDVVKLWLAWPVVHKPGEYYLYNSWGTYMLSAIMQKVTGEKLIDYLTPRLFEPLHIKNPFWVEQSGITLGAGGLRITTEDMGKLGQLFLQKGQWNGKQIVSAEWLKEMSSYQVPSAPSGTRFEDVQAGITSNNEDWIEGYGYQMWRGQHNTFRADGFAGQYIIVVPEKDAVIVLTTMSSVYQQYMNLVWKYLLPAL